MRIKSILAEDLYSYQKLEFNFDQFPGGTTLLLGKSLDDKSSNGSGKTSIMKALYFGLYGEDVYKANKSTVIRRGSSHGYYVKVAFEDRGHEYVIERFDGRKDKGPGGKGLNFFIDGDKFEGEGGLDETQSFINQKIRMSPTLFKSSVYSVQNSDKNFLETSDTSKKDLLAELLDLQVYAKAFNHIKEEIKELTEKQRDKESKIEANHGQIETLQEQVKQISAQRDGFDEEIKKEVIQEKVKLFDLKARIQAIANPVFKYDLKDIELKLETLRAEKSSLEEKVLEESKIQNTLAKINAELEQAEKYFKESSAGIKKYDKLIKDLDGITYDAKEKDSVEGQKIQLIQELKVAESSKEKYNIILLEIKDVKNSIDNLNKEIASLEKQIKVLTESEVCPTCQRSYEDEHLNHVKQEIAKLEEKKASVSSGMIDLAQDLVAKESLAKVLLADVSQIDFFKGSIKTLEDKFVQLTLLEQKFNLKEEEKARYQKEKEDLVAAIEARKVSNQRFEQGKIKVGAMAEELVPLKKRLSEIEKDINKLNGDKVQAEVESSLMKKLIEDKDSIVKQSEVIEESIARIKQKPNPYGSMIESLERKMIFFEEKIQAYKVGLKKDEEDMKYLNFWKIGFAPTGIQSFITDDVIDLLNRKVQDNLNDLFNGALSVLFDPESKNKKGIVSNKISTNFFHNGKETSFELLSGGEKRRAILATNLALAEVAESRSGTKLNICFLDEPFDGIDSAGQLIAFRLFNRLSKDKDGFFVISHDPQFQGMCQSVVYVLKKSEISRIVDQKTFEDAEILTDKLLSEKVLSSTVLEDSEKTKKEILAERLKSLSKKKDE